MIPHPTIVEWGRRYVWPTEAKTEQDLVLSRLIVEIANDRYLGDELVFRGGTCLHKAFRADLEPLVTNWPADYDIDTAADLVIRDVFGLL